MARIILVIIWVSLLCLRVYGQDGSSLLYTSDSTVMQNNACNELKVCYTRLHDKVKLLNSDASNVNSIHYMELITQQALKDSILFKDIVLSYFKGDSTSYPLLRLNMDSQLIEKLKSKKISFINDYLDVVFEFNGLPSPYGFRNLISVWHVEWFSDSDLRLLYILNLAIFKNEIEVDQMTKHSNK